MSVPLLECSSLKSESRRVPLKGWRDLPAAGMLRSVEPFEIQIARGRRAVFALEPECAALAARTADGNVFLGPEWVFTWLSTLGRRYEPVVLVARRGGLLEGFWPFFECRLPVIGTALLPACAHAADVFDPMAAPGVEHTLAEALERLAGSYAFAWLPLLSKEFTASTVDPLARKNSSRHLVRPRTPRLEIDLSRFGDFDAWEQETFGSKSRQSLRRKQRRFEDNHRVAFLEIADPAEAVQWMDRIADLEKSSWKGAEGVGVFKRADHRAFYRILFEALAASGRLRLSILLADDQPAAYEIAFWNGHRHAMHTMAFDPAYAAYSPGRLLLLHSVRRCFAEQTAVFDFLQNDQAYKRQMANRESQLHDWIVFPASLRGRLVRAAVRAVHAWTEWQARRRKAREAAARAQETRPTTT